MDIKPNITRAAAKQLDVAELTKNPDVTKIFSNGLQCGFSLSEGHIVFKHNESPLCLLSMGLPTIKSLKMQLEALISLYEKNTGQTVFSIEELIQRVNAPEDKAK